MKHIKAHNVGFLSEQWNRNIKEETIQDTSVQKDVRLTELKKWNDTMRFVQNLKHVISDVNATLLRDDSEVGIEEAISGLDAAHNMLNTFLMIQEKR